MAEQLGELTRTHTCGALRPDDVGAEVVLLGGYIGSAISEACCSSTSVIVPASRKIVFDKDDEALMAKPSASDRSSSLA